MRKLLCLLILSISLFSQTTDPFKSFTGKVLGDHVRVRVAPDLESHIFSQKNKNDLVLVLGEIGNFWAVQPPKSTKAYVYRTYIIDGSVEANRVNIRLEPHLEAPIIGQLEMGEKIDVNNSQNKWIEIEIPAHVRFYVSKEYVGCAGGAEYFAAMEDKKADAEKLLRATFIMLDSECKKSFDMMNPGDAISKFEYLIEQYSTFPNIIKQAKEGLALLKDDYTKKKIAYLEDKANSQKEVTEVVFPQYANAETGKILTGKTTKALLSSKMRFWEEVEDALYLSWYTFNTNKTIDDYYSEQKVNSCVLAGILESYDHVVKNKPGDYILKDKNNPTAYLYSTLIDLEKYIGKEVKLKVSPRPNNHFAFPAYHVISVE